MHIVDGKSIRQIAARHKIHPTILYRWKRELIGSMGPSDGSNFKSRAGDSNRRKLAALRARVDRLHQDILNLEHQIERRNDEIAGELK